MSWNDWEAAWGQQKPPVGNDADLEALRRTFEAKSRKLKRALFWRDLREGGAGLIVAAFFASTGWRNHGGWVIALAVALILGVTGFFVWERLRVRRNQLGEDATLLARVEADLAELRHQQRLLRNVATWYLAPLFAAIVIILANIYAHLPPEARGIMQHFLVWYLPACLVLFFGVWALNRRVVRKRIEPRIEELEELRRDILSSSQT